MLQEAFADLESLCLESNVEVEPVRRFLVLYLARILNAQGLISAIKDLPVAIKEQILAVKRAKFDRDEYFLSMLWRALHLHLRFFIRPEVACARYGVSRRDLLLCKASLFLDDIRRIERATMRVDRLPAVHRQELFDAITKHARVLVNRPIGSPRWIAKNDAGYEIQDIESQLWEEGFRLFLCYEHFGNRGKIRNFVKRGMQNFCVNFIMYNTARKRQALASVSGDGNREYQVVKLSLDAPRAGEDGGSLVDTIPDVLVWPDQRIHDQRLAIFLSKVPSVVRKFAHIVIENRFSRRFLDWLRTTHKLRPTDISVKKHGQPIQLRDDLGRLGQLAMEYLGTKRSVIAHYLRRFVDKDVIARWEAQAA